MADEERPQREPSLELPSLSLRRRRTRRERGRPMEPRETGTERVAVEERDDSTGELPSPAPSRPRRRIPAPPIALTPSVAATAIGLIAGLGLVGLTSAFLGACGVVRGTTSCGRTGYPLIVVVFLAVVAGAAVLLRLARVPEPTSTALLGLALTGAVALALLADVLLSHWMVLVIPLVTAATFALSHRLATIQHR